ncbi:hypothetical protein GCM10007867_25750 [Gluconobacter cerinus]|uniref:Uncharacterized protein n=1 Tax=Gluconobacter cerinus TaxID=38307 RepID=A0AAV5NH88_9PROT|nr:hypothetical protein GCM10007867_25750 [Gluconobacter cerinus]
MPGKSQTYSPGNRSVLVTARPMIVVVMMVVPVIVIAYPGSDLTVMAGHPFGVTIQIMLFLPDGHPVLDLVDDITTGSECSIAMRRGHADPDGNIPNP